jgi:hypothetical protein
MISAVVFLFIILSPTNEKLFGQNSQLPSLSSIPMETIRIVKPLTGENVSTREGLMISGVSSDNGQKQCSVSVIVNDVRPYQVAVAKGTGGTNDFSQWEFELSSNYTQIVQGQNKITSKLECPPEPTRWYSVFVSGVSKSSNEEPFSPLQPRGQQQQNLSADNLPIPLQEQQQQQQQNLSADNLPIPLQEQQQQQQQNLSPDKLPVHPTQKEQQNILTDNISESIVSANGNNGNNNVLKVSILPLKNPVTRGDSQNTTITVTDSSSRPVANAEIVGKLIYPGGNYEKDFSGITDSQGKFVYSWTIGKKGDIGRLSIEVEISSQSYQPSSGIGSFDVIK